MNKKILVLFAFIIATFSIKAQQCQNLDVENTVATCAIPTTTLSANFLNTGYKTTDTYLVNGPAVCPPVQSDPTSAQIALDDQWAPIIFNIGFTFCYYGNMYDQVIVSGNGVVSFDLGVVEDYLITNPNGTGPHHTWNTDASLDLPSPQLQPNAIFGPFTDPNPATAANPFETIKFDLVNQDDPGNRVFVVEYDAPMFSCGSEFLHSRIKLYETSNVIDIEILEKGRCDGWENSTGIVGIQNKSATLATIVPGRTNADGGWWVNGDPNYGGNVAEQELWRFIPDGNPLSYSFKWFADYGQGNGLEELFPNQTIDDPTIIVNPESPTDYQAVLTYQSECAYNDIVLTETISIDAPDHENIQPPLDLAACETTFGSGLGEFDLDQQDVLLSEYINSTTTTWDLNDFTITYHASEDDRDNQIAITDINTYLASNGAVIYVRIIYDDGTINCFDVYNEFTLNVLSLENNDFSYNTISCSNNVNPLPNATPTTGIDSYTIDNGGVIVETTGEIDLQASGLGNDGTGIFTIDRTTATTYLLFDIICENTSNFQIQVDLFLDSEFDYPSPSVCKGSANPFATNFEGTVNFTISSPGILEDASTGEIKLEDTPPGMYTITHTLNAGTICEDTTTHQIEVLPKDNADFSYPTYDFCSFNTNTPDYTAVLTSNTTVGTFEIDNSGVFTNNTTGQIDLVASGAGTFHIRYNTSGDCPISSNWIEVTIHAFIDSDFTYPTDACLSDTGIIAEDYENGGEFSINPSDSSSPIIDSTTGELTITGSTVSGNYDIIYSFDVGGLCESITTKILTIHSTPTSGTQTTIPTECNVGDGNAEFDVTLFEDEILNNQTDIDISYFATFDDANNDINELITTPVLRANGNIFARLENQNGCFSISEIYVTIEDCYAILPQGFSPSSNNVQNQTFDIINLRSTYPKFTISIYNRNGNLVFEGDATSDNWNGKVDNEGDILPAGTYFYALELNGEQGLKYRGWVYLQQ